MRYGDGTDDARLASLARHITGGAALVYDPTLNDADGVVVVTGSDFTTIHDQPAPEGSPDDRRITTSTVPRRDQNRPGGEHHDHGPHDHDDRDRLLHRRAPRRGRLRLGPRAPAGEHAPVCYEVASG